MKKKSLVLLVALCLLVVTALTGCNSPDKNTTQSEQPKSTKTTETDKSTQSEQPKLTTTTVEVILYFSDEQANFLVPEKRIIRIATGANDEVLATNIIKELIAGPKNKELVATIPAETKILSVKIDKGIAYTNFSKELQSKHWGGSTGEIITLNSIANTLTELDSIDKVQLLIEGKKVESLVGHWDTTVPLERNEEIIRK